MKLALQVFSSVVAEGLLVMEGKDNIQYAKETSEYIQLMCKWWSIINVKTLFKEKHKLDKFQEALTERFVRYKICFFKSIFEVA